MRHALIMAGGAGTRLWPLSRKRRPKQVLRLLGGTSLLRQAYERAALVLPPQAINVITNETHLPQVAEELPELPSNNLIGEPIGRDTANAIGLGAAVLLERDADATMGVFTADHVITPLDHFAAAVETAFDLAERRAEVLVTFGIRPHSPNTSYGYVRRGKEIAVGVYQVQEFTEKPDQPAATRYVKSGEYYWNSGMFVWQAKTILNELKRQLPQSHDALREIAANWHTEERTHKLELLYPTLVKVSIDFAVMEHADHVLVVEMDCDWMDVGSWTALEALQDADDSGNIAVCKRALHLDSRGNIVVAEGDHLIATIGVDDLVIVHSDDATLICSKRQTQGIKELVDKLHSKYGEQYT